MVAIQAENLSKEYGTDVIFSGVRFSVQEGEKIGLIGANGSGKSTLLKILAGLEQADSGSFRTGQSLSVGYLKQEKTGTLREGEQTFSGGELARIDFDRLLSERPDILLLDEPTNHLDLDMLEWVESFVRHFSGTVITVSHDRYFLDRTVGRIFELDRGSLRTYKGNYSEYAVKRAGEEEAARRAAEKEAVERARQEAMIRHMKERGTELLAKRAASREKRLRLADRKREPVDKSLLSRSTGGGKAMKISFGDAKRSGENVLLADGLTLKVTGNSATAPTLAKNKTGFLSGHTRHGDASLCPAQDKGARQGDASLCPANSNAEFRQRCEASERTLFEGVGFDIRRGEKICMIGKNGVGKTTLLNTIMGAQEPASGFIRLGVGVKTGYYDQHRRSLGSGTILEEIQDALPLMSDTDRRKLLGSFLFKGDMVFRDIASLSGGEKARLSLLKLIVGGANFLLLDEPTNHLDIASMEAVESALEDFDGTILAVSHDRYFLERIPSRIFELTENGLAVYPGNYEYYVDKKKGGEAAARGTGVEGPGAGRTSGTGKSGAAGSGAGMTDPGGSGSGGIALPCGTGAATSSATERRLKKQDEAAKRRRARLLSENEKAVAEKEALIENLRESLSEPSVATDAAKLKEIHENIVWNEHELEALLEEWEELMGE